MTRRTALAAAAAVAVGAVAGCTSPARDAGEEDRTDEQPADPDVLLAAAAAADQRAVLELVRATTRRHPGLRERLRAARDVHQRHLEVLSGAAAAAVPSPSPSVAPGGAEPPGLRVPRGAARALAAVAAAERDVATATKRHAFNARSGAFARLLGGVAAAAAQQAALLDGAASPTGPEVP